MTDRERKEQEIEKKLEKAFDMCEQFERDINFSRQFDKNFSELICELMEKKKVFDGSDYVFIKNKTQFKDITGLGPSTYDRIVRRTDDYVPSLVTFITLCMVYDLDLAMALILRDSYGYGFNRRNRVHRAYCYLLTNCRGKSISYCNRVLESLKIEEKYYLGDKQIDKYALLYEIGLEE